MGIPSRSASEESACLPIVIAGPTAVGKSEIAIIVAERVGGEIISADSMQVYRGLDIGTAKPPVADRAGIPHHLIDVIGLDEVFDAAKFVTLARTAAGEIAGRGRVPVFCGGTGLYLKAYFDGLGESPGSDPALRARLETIPLNELLNELAAGDPETYARIDRQNPRRVIRAVEIIRMTGRPASAQRASWETPAGTGPAQAMIVLTRTSADLRQRIDRRVEEMFRCGLVEETRRLLETGLSGNRTAMQALGYRQVIEHLRGERELDETIELVKIRTRQFAKRQLTWFRKQRSARWLALAEGEGAGEIAGRVLRELGRASG